MVRSEDAGPYYYLVSQAARASKVEGKVASSLITTRMFISSVVGHSLLLHQTVVIRYKHSAMVSTLSSY